MRREAHNTEIFISQVWTKNAEIGIGQLSFASYRYNLVDYLPWMYIYEFPFVSRLPREVTSFDTLIRPFDGYTWITAFVATAIFYFALVITQKLWTFQSGNPYKSDFLYEGISFFIQ